jgi:hypothetical protein
MKTLIQYNIVLVLCVIVFACNNDFLSNEPELSSLNAATEIYISPEKDAGNYSIHVPMAGNARFRIDKTPDWLSVETLSGQFENNVATIYCSASIHKDFSGRGIYKSSMVLDIEGYGKTPVPVSYVTEGNPAIEFETHITFQDDNHNASLIIKNKGEGILLWSLAEKPDWIAINKPEIPSGALSNYVFMIPRNEEFEIDLSHTLEMPISDDLTGKILIINNDKGNPLYEVTVTVAGEKIDDNFIHEIDGTVTDVRMDKTTGILYLITSYPNRLIAYNTETKTIDKELDLDKAPTCFSISEDRLIAIIGHDKMISWVNLNFFSIMKTIDMESNIFDIECSADNWCCYTWEQDEYYYLHWINLVTEEIVETPSIYAFFFGKTAIKKIPGKDFIVATRLSDSPSRIFVYNVHTRDHVGYFSQDTGKFWFSSDGNYLFSSKNEIFETASLVASSGKVSLVGNFSPEPNNIHWVDHNAESHTVLILSNSSDSADDSLREIQQYDDKDFTHIKTYNYNGLYAGHSAQAQYVFSNNQGSELIVIKNNSFNEWAIEHVPVTD